MTAVQLWALLAPLSVVIVLLLATRLARPTSAGRHRPPPVVPADLPGDLDIFDGVGRPTRYQDGEHR